MSSFLPDTDSEDELPVGWEERATLDGKVYYANHNTETTQWTHPKSGKKKKLAGELPFGWVMETQEDGTVIYKDTINDKTTLTDPRLAFAVEEKSSPSDISQHFDSSSTALQVLHGRDLSGKVAIVTGGNCGIGYETCRALAFHGAHVIMACRSLDRAQAAIEQIKKERSHCQLTPLQLDLESLASVREFAQSFTQLSIPLHILILNAGVFALPHRITEDGLERTFQVNHLSNFLLVQLLEKHLLTSAPSRVIVVSSESHRFSFLTCENIDHEYLSPQSSSRFVPMVAYNDSKLCNVLFANQLNRRLGKHKVACYSVHPGNMISTSLSRNWWFYRILFALARPFTKSPEQGASTTVYAATSLDLESLGGLYLNNCCRCNPSKSAQDVKLAQLLWTLSDKMIEGALSPQTSKSTE